MKAYLIISLSENPGYIPAIYNKCFYNENEAQEFCDEWNKDKKYTWEKIDYEEIEIIGAPSYY